MLSERVKIIENNQEEVWVEALPSAHCGSCAGRGGCGQALLAVLRPARAVRLDKRLVKAVSAPGALKTGGFAHMQITENKLLALSSLFYLLPLTGMLVATVVANLFAASDLQVALAGLGALAGSFLGLRAWFASRESVREETVVLTAVNSEVGNYV